MIFKSLYAKVSVSVATAAVFVVVVSSYWAYERAYRQSFTESERSVQQLLETVSATAAIAAYVGNKELAQQVVEGLSINDIVVGARITAGQTVLSEQGTGFAVSGSELATITLDLAAPFDQQELVGQLAVMPNRPLIANRARESALATTVGLATQAAVVGLLVLILVYLLMSRPLARLSNRLHAITPGDGNRVSVAKRHRNDEIGVLAKDINGLLDTVDMMLLEERQLRHRVESLEHRFRGIFEDSSAGIFLVSEEGALFTANPAFFGIIGSDHASLAAATDVISAVFADAQQARALICDALATQQPRAADLALADNSGKLRWVHCIFSPAGSEPRGATVEGVMYDITRRKQDEEHTRELAEKDSLTGLLNRQMADRALETMADSNASEGKGLVVMMIDLDGFKRINDSYGHDAGDEMLKVVAQRLCECVRETDVVARLGGDEFMIILDRTNNVETASKIAQKIVERQREPVAILPDVQERTGVSVGIAIYPDHGDDMMTLRRYADQAMYAVKRRGKNSYAIYEPQLKRRDAGS